MTRLRLLSPLGILVLGGVPGRPVVWLHEPIRRIARGNTYKWVTP